MCMSKAELVAALTSDEDQTHLDSNSSWQLRSKLIVWRFVAFSFFMLDVHEQLAILSKSFQSNSLLAFEIAKHVNRTLRALEKLKEARGEHEKAFWVEVRKNEDADVLRTCQLNNGEEGREQLKSDRKQVLEALNHHLIDRYRKVLDNDILRSMTAFDHRHWPTRSGLEGLYDLKIEVLYEAFQGFYQESETLENVLEQWNEMSTLIVESPGSLHLRKYHELWPHMLVHFATSSTRCRCA